MLHALGICVFIGICVLFVFSALTVLNVTRRVCAWHATFVRFVMCVMSRHVLRSLAASWAGKVRSHLIIPTSREIVSLL